MAHRRGCATKNTADHGSLEDLRELFRERGILLERRVLDLDLNGCVKGFLEAFVNGTLEDGADVVLVCATDVGSEGFIELSGDGLARKVHIVVKHFGLFVGKLAQLGRTHGSEGVVALGEHTGADAFHTAPPESTHGRHNDSGADTGGDGITHGVLVFLLVTHRIGELSIDRTVGRSRRANEAGAEERGGGLSLSETLGELGSYGAESCGGYRFPTGNGG